MKNWIYKSLILVLTLALSQACKKKELPAAEEGEPVFMIDTKVNGNALQLTAGKDQYYMYTSYQLDGLGINVLKGTLRSIQCEGCNHEFTISYRDSYYRNNLIINNIGEVLKPGNYYFYNGVDTGSNNITQGTVINFTAYAPPGTNYSYQWDFGDGGISTLPNPSHQYTEPADYQVCLTVNSAGYPSKTICNTITMDTLCRFQFNQSMSQNFVNIYTQGGANSFAWNFGDSSGIQLSGSTTSHTYSQAGIYRIIMRDTLSSLTCGNEFQKDLLVGSFNGNELAAGFNYTYSNVAPIAQLPVDSGFRKVTIMYTSPNGTKYSTYHPSIAHQQINNTFVVTKAEPYQNNSAGQKTYKMEGNFKAWLYNVNNNNDSTYIETNKFIMGVAFP
jgi:hypothetical protein